MAIESDVRHIRGACPLDCPDTCGWIVTVKDGEPVALRGDPTHPYTRGSLCNKVADYLTYARSPDRLLYPMRRTGPKGSGEFSRISWDEALERIAAELGDTIAKHGAEAIWPFAGSGNMGLIQGIYGAGQRLWNVLGTSRHVFTLCTIAGGHGTGYTLGDNRVGMDPETFRFSKLVVLWGANVLSTHPHLWRPILEARKSGATIVAIDPIRTRTAAASDWHLARGSFFAVAEVTDRIRPGVVASPKGRWPGKSKQGATVNAIVAARDSDMGRGAVYHDNRVRVERIRQEVI